MAIKPKDMAKMIDYTIIAANTDVKEVKKKCKDALEYDFAAVCVNTSFIPLAAKILKNSSVKVCAMIDFPLGASTSETKAFATKDAIKNGTQEIDISVNLSAIKDGKWGFVEDDIKAVFDATKIAGVTRDIMTKVVIEADLLTEEELVKTSLLAKDVGVDFIKNRVNLDDLQGAKDRINLIRKVVGRGVGVEAFGEIKSFADAMEMLDAGANRIGTATGVEIVTDNK